MKAWWKPGENWTGHAGRRDRSTASSGRVKAARCSGCTLRTSMLSRHGIPLHSMTRQGGHTCGDTRPNDSANGNQKKWSKIFQSNHSWEDLLLLNFSCCLRQEHWFVAGVKFCMLMRMPVNAFGCDKLLVVNVHIYVNTWSLPCSDTNFCDVWTFYALEGVRRVRKERPAAQTQANSMKQSCHCISCIPSQRAHVYQLQLPQLLQLLQFFQPTMTTYDYHVDYYGRILQAPGSTMVSWVPCITQQEWKDTHGKTEKNRNVHTTRPHLLMAPLSSSSKPKLIQEPFMDEPGNTSQKNKLRNYSMPHAILWHTQLDFPCMIYVHVCVYI